MKPEKLIKKQIIEEASAHPEKYFPVKALDKIGMKRQKCANCGVMFWSTQKRKTCGDTNCVGEYSFIGNTPAAVAMSFPEVYIRWREYIEKRGYPHVDRFPIVARWRDDMDFNIASIIGFQPYVTKGISPPPHELLSIPQNCLRFADIDNIGYTGRHFTSFTMIGQCAFKQPQEYDQAKYVMDLLEWFTIGMGIPVDELQIHEDAWVGGGDCGPSMEFFSRGLELANQVYMWFDMSNAKDISEIVPLKLKVLDMGMGQESCCWFSKASLDAYSACMPAACEYLFKITKLEPKWELYKKFLPYSGMLNLDEAEDIDAVWSDIAKNVKTDVATLKKEVEPIAGIYSIADHTRSLLYALTDGALPSNVKGGYNLRLILRRALDFINKYSWDVDLFEVMKIHAEELKPLYPELLEAIKEPSMKRVIDLEVKKYHAHKEKIENKISSLVKKDANLTEEDFIKLYISDGIMPNEIKESFAKQNKNIEIPANFFTLVTEYFASQKQSEVKEQKNKLAQFIKEIPETKLLYYDDVNKEDAEAKILKEFDFEGSHYIILDKTLFYPTMGGQASDKGMVGDKKLIEAIKVENVILHKVK